MFSHICIFLISISFFCSTQIAPTGVEPTSVEPATSSLFSLVNTTTEKKIKQSTLYLKANYFQNSGKFLQALRTYNYLFTLDAPDYIYEGYLRLLSQTNQFPTIVNLIDKTQDLFKDDIDIQLIYAQSLLNTNRDKQAKSLLSDLKKKHKNNEQVVYYMAALSEKSNNLTKALADIDAFLSSTPRKTKHFFFHFLKAKIYLKMGNPAQSLASINASLRLFPKFDKGILFKALLLEQTKKISAAIECYKDFLDISGENPPVVKQLVQLLFSQKRFGEAAKYLKKIKTDQPAYHFDLALLEWKARNFDQALLHAKTALEKNPRFTKAKILTIQILLEQKKFPTILKSATRWLKQTPNDNHLIHTLLLLSQKQLSPHAVIRALEQVKNKHKKQTNIPLAMADLFLHTNQHEKAIYHYQQVFDSTKNNTLKAKINFQVAFIYFKTNNKKRAASWLKKALSAKIVHPGSYNLMALMLAQSGKKLDHALLLADKALASNARSAHFLDTKGFILYKQRKYNQAIVTLQKALEYAPTDKLIQKHLYDAKTRQ